MALPSSAQAPDCQTMSVCFPPNRPRINVRSIDRSGLGFAAVDIAAVLWQTCQRSAQPFSCRERSDLFRSAVQHGDGCRRRFSIRQTRSPKQARSFWCLFLKKARPICAAHLAHATRASIPHPPPHAARPMRRAPHSQPEIPFPRHSGFTSSPTPAASTAPKTDPPSCVSRSLFPARPMRAARNGTRI